MTDDELEALSDAVLEGRDVDWNAAIRSTDPTDRRRIAGLRVMADLAAASAARRRSAEGGGSEDVPITWGQFTLIEPIGHGTSGEVWRAHDPHLQRDVALKILAATDDAEATRVLKEGRLLARLHHPNVATVFGVTLLEGEIGVAMEFVPGEDLETRVRERGPLNPADVVDIGIQLARALEAVHRAGLLHRDVKAANVKRAPNGRVVLLDFGSGRDLNAGNLTEAGECGTPLYVAPEVLQGSPATPQSDLYSLGVLLFRLLTARHPIEASSIDELRTAHGEGEKPQLGLPGVPRRLSAFIEAALNPSPSRRPASAHLAAAMLAGRSRRTWWTIGAAAVALTLAAWALPRSGAMRPDMTHQEPLRRIDWPVAPYIIGTPSRDGRLIPFSQRLDGALAVLDVSSGIVSQLSAPGDVLAGYAMTSAASRDGSLIAYTFYVRACDCVELRTVAVGTGRHETLWRWSASVEPRLGDWSPDGRSLALSLINADGPGELVTMTAGAPPRVIARGYHAGPSFSDDGRDLVFHGSAELNGKAHLWLFDTRAEILRPILAEGFDDRNAVWLGDSLVFESNRGGEAAAWAASIDRARHDVSGRPRRLLQEAGISPAAATIDGGLFYRRGTGSTGIAVGSLDGAQPPQRLTKADGGASPDWSPDGNALAWIEEPAVSPLQHLLHVYDFQSGRDKVFSGLGRDFRTHMIGLNPRFRPNSRSILVRSAGRGGVRLVDLESGAESATYLTAREFGDVEWDPDGRFAYFLDQPDAIGRLDMRTGLQDVIYRTAPETPLSRGIAVSPDGRRIAFTVQQREPAGIKIMTIDSDGRNARALLHRPEPHRMVARPVLSATPLLLGEWTADGSMLLFAVTETLANGFVRAETELWGIPSTGGEPVRMGLSAPGLRDVRPHPDGRRVAYGYNDERFEFWLLRDALRTDVVR